MFSAFSLSSPRSILNCLSHSNNLRLPTYLLSRERIPSILNVNFITSNSCLIFYNFSVKRRNLKQRFSGVSLARGVSEIYNFSNFCEMRNTRSSSKKESQDANEAAENSIKVDSVLNKFSRKRKESEQKKESQKSEKETKTDGSDDPAEIIHNLDESKSKLKSKTETETESKLTPESKPKKTRSSKTETKKKNQNIPDSEAIDKINGDKGLEKEEKDEKEVSKSDLKPWLINSHKIGHPEWSVYDPKSMRKRENSVDNDNRNDDDGDGDDDINAKKFKIISWNVNGLRALLKKEKENKNLLDEICDQEDPDVICIQETKIQEKDIEVIHSKLLPEYKKYWNCSQVKLGYSGCALFTKHAPISIKYEIEQFDDNKEGRIICAEFDHFFIVNAYVPNSGDKLERLPYREKEWDPALSNFLKQLEKSKPVILTGDLNCAHQEIDIHNPNGNRRSAGFTDEERSSFGKQFMDAGFADTFRKMHPNSMAFTYWGYRFNARAKNAGWRLDYFLVSESLMERVFDSFTMPHIYGSDHCPLGLTLTL